MLRTSPRRSVIFDGARQWVTFVSSRLLFFKKVNVVAFDEIDQVCLDYVEETVTGDYGQTESIERKWVIFLALRDSRTIPVADVATSQYAPGDFADMMTRQSAYSEDLAAKICELTGKTLVRMPSVPGGLHTFVESVDQILQRRLAQSRLHDRSVHLRSNEDGGLEIIVDGTMYDDLDKVRDQAIRDLIQAALDEWQGR
jgi:hypothetical protein